MQEGADAGKGKCRKGQMLERVNARKGKCQKGWMPERADAGEGSCWKGRMSERADDRSSSLFQNPDSKGVKGISDKRIALLKCTSSSLDVSEPQQLGGSQTRYMLS
jgi:hypothetical protein